MRAGGRVSSGKGKGFFAQSGVGLPKSIARQLPPAAKDSPVFTTTPILEREYSTFGYKPTSFLGRKTLTARLIVPELSQSGKRGIVLKAHEEDFKITLVKPNKPKKEAIVLHNAQLHRKKPMDSDSFMVIPKEENPQIISTTNQVLHSALRDNRKLSASQSNNREDVVKQTDQVLGGVTVDSLGPYFGGNPTVILSRNLKEAIYPDATLLDLSGINAFREASEETEKHGPRLSSHRQSLLVFDKSSGLYRTELLESRAFVNSTIHRGMQKGPDGQYHPVTCYTPGSSLLSHSKSRVALRHDGSTLQTISIATNASADVLTHWILNAANEVFGKDAHSLSGLKRIYSDKGVVESLIVHQGLGQKLTHFGLLFTGTPFDMTTMTIHRDKEGNALHIMSHKRTKPWPANEAVIEITGPDGKRQCVIYDSIIPKVGFWRDFTVTKLAAPILNESVVMGAIEEGQLKDITDKELLEDMVAQNEKGRFTLGELLKEDVPISMKMAAAGLTKSDPRSRVTLVSPTGDFDKEKLIRQHMAQEPRSVEYYFCGRAARILAENLEAAIQDNYSLWEENASIRNLWSIVTSAVPTYENITEYATEYSTVIKEIMKDPAEVQRMDECLKWAREASDLVITEERTLAH